MTRSHVDFGLLHPLSGPQVFTQVDRALRPRLEAMPEVLDRVEGCVHLCYLTNADPAGTQLGDPSPARVRQKFLRAALCEFASISDAAKLDFDAAGKRAPGMRQLVHPQIHVVRLLRHANVHLTASTLAKESRPAVWPGPEGRVEFEHTHYIVANLAATVRETARARDYTAADLSRMLEWLESEQREWGIANVVHRTAEIHGALLADSWADG